MTRDNFTTQASDYARYRPSYPPELFEYILQFFFHRDNAWDCATGNGRAALALAPHFKQVFATDISEKQISMAVPDPAIIYSVGSAERTSFADSTFNLITVAQAYHWFDFAGFCAEAVRVAQPGCIIAVWGYNVPKANEPHIDELVHEFYTQTVGPYWDKERRYVDEELRTVPFPFDELPPATNIAMQKHWTLHDLIGYLGTWSSVQHYKNANAKDPLTGLELLLREYWGDDAAKNFTFPLFMRIGRINK